MPKESSGWQPITMTQEEFLRMTSPVHYRAYMAEKAAREQQQAGQAAAPAPAPQPIAEAAPVSPSAPEAEDWSEGDVHPQEREPMFSDYTSPAVGAMYEGQPDLNGNMDADWGSATSSGEGISMSESLMGDKSW